MSISKQIRVNDGSNREFEAVTTSELQFDLVPEVGSFRPVVSDGVAKALEVATEIPVVTAETAGKVLTASWNAETSTGSTSWEEAQGAGAAVIEYNSSHTYTSEECAALVSQVSAATDGKKPVYVCDVSASSMYPPRYALLSFTHWGPSYYTEYVFIAPTTSATTSAQINGAQNSNPNGAIYRLTRSSFTREGANVRSLPTTDSGTLGKVLGVTDGNGTLGWVEPQNLREGDAISIENSLVSVSHDGTLATEGGITSLAGDDGVSFNLAMHYYEFTLTSEEADALNAEISANGSITVGLHFATTPVLSIYGNSQCYLHVYGGPSIGGISGVSALIGRSDAQGVLTADLSHVTVGSFTGAFTAGVFRVWISDSSVAPEPYGANKCDFTSDGHTPIAADISVGPYSSQLSVSNPVPSYTTSEDGKVLGVVDNSGTAELQWLEQQNLSAGDGIDITGGEVSAKVGAGLEIADYSNTTTVTKTLSAPHVYESDPVTCICPASEIADALRSGTIDLTTTMAFQNARNDVIHAFLCVCLWDSNTRTPISPYYETNGGIVFNPEISLSGSTGNWVIPANTTIQTDTFNNLWYSNTTVQYILEHIDEYCLCLICLDSNYENFWGDESYMRAPSSAAPGTVPTATTTYTSTVTITDALNVANPVPSYTSSEDGKILGVVDNMGAAELQWVAQQDTTYTAGNGIDITGGIVSAKVDAGLEITDNAVSVKAGRGLEISDKWGTSTACGTGPGDESINLSATLTMELLQNIVSGSGTSLLVGDSGMTMGPSGSGYHWFRLEIYDSSWHDRGTLSTFAYKEEGRQVTGPVEIDWANASSTSPVSSILANMTSSDLVFLTEMYGDGTTPSGRAGVVVGSGTYTVKVASPTGNALDITNPVPSTAGVPNSAVLAMGNSGMEWVEGGVPSYMDITSGTVSIARDNTIVTSTADMTSIVVGANVKSAVVQWTVASTTTLPTVTDGTNALKAAVNNPLSLTVGRTVQVSILNGTWVCAEFA